MLRRASCWDQNDRLLGAPALTPLGDRIRVCPSRCLHPILTSFILLRCVALAERAYCCSQDRLLRNTACPEHSVLDKVQETDVKT